MKILKKISLLFLLALSSAGFSQTLITPGIHLDEYILFTEEKSPYVIFGEVTLESDSIMIEKGTRIEFADSASELIFKTPAFYASGDFNNPIIIEGDSLNPQVSILGKGQNAWAHLENVYFMRIYEVNLSSFKSSEIIASKFEEAYNGLIINNSENTYLERCTFMNNTVGLFSTTKLNVTESNFANNINGYSMNEGILTNSFFNNNDIGLITNTQDSASIQGNNFRDNVYAILESNLETYIKANNFCNNELDFMHEHHTTVYSYSGNTFCKKPAIQENVLITDYIEPSCLPSLISDTLILTKAGSPYTICKNTTVESQALLLIEKGATLIFDDSLFVYGRIETAGDSSEYAEFKNSKNFGGYIDILFLEENSSVTFNGLLSSVNFVSETIINIQNSFFTNSNANIRASSFYATNTKFKNFNLNSSLYGKEFNILNSHYDGGIIYVPALNNFVVSNSSFDSTGIFNSGKKLLVKHSTFNYTNFVNYSQSDSSSIHDNSFINASHLKISDIKMNYTIRDNVFQNNENCLEIINGNVTLINNQFINSKIGVELLQNPDSVNKLPVFENNYFCNEVDVKFSTYNNSNFNIPKYSFANNCWCKNANSELTIMRDDLIFHPKNGKLWGDSISFLPLANSCNPIIIDTIPNKTYYSISGTVAKENAGLLVQGYALLFDKYENVPIQKTEIKNGLFTFNKVDSAHTFTILIVPGFDESHSYLPIFYSNKNNILDANYINVYGNISGINLTLKANKNVSASTEPYLFYADEADSTTIKLLVDAKGTIADWAFVKNNHFQFNSSIDNMYIQTPHSGFTQQTDSIINNENGIYYLEKIDLISAISQNTTNYELAIYPNPTSSTLHFDNNSEISYEILDQQGVQIISGTTSENSIDVSSLKNGAYTLKTNNESNTSTQKFVKIQ